MLRSAALTKESPPPRADSPREIPSCQPIDPAVGEYTRCRLQAETLTQRSTTGGATFRCPLGDPGNVALANIGWRFKTFSAPSCPQSVRRRGLHRMAAIAPMMSLPASVRRGPAIRPPADIRFPVRGRRRGTRPGGAVHPRPACAQARRPEQQRKRREQMRRCQNVDPVVWRC